MQFLEYSIFGLRAARHVLSHPESGRTVTLFPMVHLGQAKFYDTVFKDAESHEVVLVEGIDSPVVRRLTRAYRWTAPKRLGLIQQPKFITDATCVIHADLPAKEFESLWRSAPLRERALYEIGATAVGLWQRLTASREKLARGLCTNDLTDRDDILVWNTRRAAMLTALKGARDAALCRAMTDALSGRSEPQSIAVIYGAGHMSALVRALDKKGFSVVDSQWLTVFEIEDSH